MKENMTVRRDYRQIVWDEAVEDDCRQLVRLAVREDLERKYDWTTIALVDHVAHGRAAVVARQPGIVAGLPAARVVLEEMAPSVAWLPHVEDGAAIVAGQTLAIIEGPARNLLTCERIVLNFLGRLCGVATLTATYVAAVAGTQARIYDTRKTTPGWRRLEKYAVQCGGGHNHRLGLFDGILIKDNHLALGASTPDDRYTPVEAIARARELLAQAATDATTRELLIEIEVDTFAQLEEVLPARPDIVLLDNMTTEELRQAVARRNELAPGVELEASGGINLSTLAAIAATGVDRISSGALTHSAIALDVGLDWLI
jgi:nicotinate-nucleotide pyrophosphorylase (carboxylating)